MTYFQRGLLAAVLIVIGFFFWPLLGVGGLIAWSVYSDIRNEPERKEVAFRDVLADFHGGHLSRADAPSLY